MSLTVTLCLLILCAAIIAASIRAARRPVELGKPRLVPHNAMQIALGCVMLILLAHLVTLATGAPFIGRSGY